VILIRHFKISAQISARRVLWGIKENQVMNPNLFRWDYISGFLIGIPKLEMTSKHLFLGVLFWRISEVDLLVLRERLLSCIGLIVVIS
jgi:hypothetical protein